MSEEYYNSKYYSCEEIDRRLLQGTYDDAVKAGYTGTKEQFDSLLARLENNILAIELKDNGKLVASYSADNSAFTEGKITENGKLVLTFNY